MAGALASPVMLLLCRSLCAQSSSVFNKVRLMVLCVME
jgi:hypothetical protein